MSAQRHSSIPVSVGDVVAGMPHAVWRANQMGSYAAPVVASGYACLDEQLPNHGWPRSALIELLLQQQGIGEMQLLRPALQTLATQHRIALIQPPYLPQVATWSAWGMPAEHLLWIKAASSADALWSTEQILRHGACAAVILWQMHLRAASLRRLHLAAQGTDTFLWLMRPLAEAPDSSPAPLRLGLRPARGGIDVRFVKRRGPVNELPTFVPFETMPCLPLPNPVPVAHHALLDRSSPALASTGRMASLME